MISEDLHPSRHPIISGDCHSSVSKRSEVFGRIEAEKAEFPDSASVLDPF